MSGTASAADLNQWHDKAERGRYEAAPDIEVLGRREAHDGEGKSYRQTRTLLSHHPDLAGIYNIGGVARALKEARCERDVVFLSHGLTAETRALLIDGTLDAVLNQDPRHAFASLKARGY